MNSNRHEVAFVEAVFALRIMQLEATHAPDPVGAQQRYRTVVVGGQALLGHADALASVSDYLALCDILCDSESVLNQHADALWHAKLACAVVDGLDEREKRPDKLEIRSYHFNMLRMQGVAYGNLKDYRSALRILKEAEGIGTSLLEPGWMVLLQRDKIIMLARMTRFSIGEVNACADRAQTLCDHSWMLYPDLLMLLVNQSVAEANIHRGNYRGAQRHLQKYEHQLERVHGIGPLHKVIFLRTCAQFCLATGDEGGSIHHVQRAYQLALQAGLKHQQSEIESDFNAAGRSDLIQVS
jgi:hypothetical protein